MTINIPNSVTSIDNDAFYGCSSLESITIPRSITNIANGAFRGCSNLTSVTIQCPKVGVNWFWGCKNLSEIIIESSVTSIGERAFTGLCGLKSINIPNSVTSIGSDAFSGCSGLSSVTIPNGITHIGERAFLDCRSLNSVSIGNSVMSIETDAFNYCENLSSVIISDVSSWCKINFVSETSNPLYYAHHLYLNGIKTTNLVIPNDVTTINPYSFVGGSFNSVTIGHNVTNIDYNSFKDCASITSLTFLCPKIDNWYFKLNSIKEVIIGESVETIEKNAFEGFTDVIVKTLSPTPPALNGAIQNAVVEAPYGAAVNYSLTEVWKDIDTIYSVKNGVKLYPVPIVYEGDIIIEANGKEIGCDAAVDENVDIVLKNKLNCYVVTLNNKYIGNTLDKEGKYSFKPSVRHKDNLIYSCAYTPITAHVQTSGTLIDKIGIDNVNKVQSLKVSGDLNGTDIMVIRKMANLKLLDMADANIVDGGSSYYQKYVTSKDAIGDYFFNDKKNFLRINLPNSISVIKGWAFDYCEKLMAITIPNGVTSIGAGAFSSCKNLTTITIPNSVSSIERGAFSYCI